MNKNITKQGLLRLKNSHPIPIMAHTHEIIIPCVYTETVQKFLDKKGIKLPLTHHQLAEFKRDAAKVHGKIKEDEGEDEGNSHARGTHNIKVSNIKGHVYINTTPNKARRKRGKRAPSRKIITSASGLIPPPASMRIQPPPSNTIRPNYNTFATIRPQGITYSANTPTLHDIQQELKAEQKKEKEVIEKREKELISQGEIQRKNIDSLTKALEAERRKEQALVVEDTRLNKPGGESSSSASASSSSASSSSSSESNIRKLIIDDIKEFKKARPTLEELKEGILELMNLYSDMSEPKVVLTQSEKSKIVNANNHQDIYAHFLSWSESL